MDTHHHHHHHSDGWIYPHELCAEFGCCGSGLPTPCCFTTLCPEHRAEHVCPEEEPMIHECPYQPVRFFTLAEAYRSYIAARRAGSLRGQTLHAHWCLLNLWQCDDEALAEDALPDCPDCGVPMSTEGECSLCESESRWQTLWS